MRIAVVGAGISGLTCAYELQKKGYQVEVFEKESQVGGRMITRKKGDLGFDMGADIFFQQYKATKALSKELGLLKDWRSMPNWRHALWRFGALHPLSSSQRFFALRFGGLSLWARLRMLFFVALFGWRMRGLNFFNLSEVTAYDTQSADDFTRRWAGKEVADHLVDGIVATYQFHGARDMSSATMLAFLGMMGEGYHLSHTLGGMSAIPEALRKKLSVKLSTPVQQVCVVDDGIQLSRADSEEVFDAVVLACPAPLSARLLHEPSEQQRKLFETVRYAATVTVSFRVPLGLFGETASATFARSDSKKIAYFCHEYCKEDVVHEGMTLVNVGLHHAFAPQAMELSDQEIFNLVKTELLKYLPFLEGKGDLLQPYDLQRWPYAMPMFYKGSLQAVESFLEWGQGLEGIFLCGDYLNSPWVEGSVRCGQRVAQSVADYLEALS